MKIRQITYEEYKQIHTEFKPKVTAFSNLFVYQQKKICISESDKEDGFSLLQHGIKKGKSAAENKYLKGN